MTLIKSISGIRGTIGGPATENLTPLDIVKFTTAYVRFIAESAPGKRLKIVVGRDARISGEMVGDIIEGTLLGCGADVVNIGLCTTPGTELAVTAHRADGGIIITASHNPRFKRNDERTIYNVLYRDGKNGPIMMKRCAIKAITRDKEYDITKGTPKSEILYMSVNPNGEAEVLKVYFKPRPRLKKVIVDLDFSTLAIKGRQSQGNLFSRYGIHKIVLKERGTSTLGGQNVWFDEDVRRLNADGRGKLLGEFKGDDRIIVWTSKNQYYITGYDLGQHFPDETVRVSRYEPDRVYSVCYYDRSQQFYYMKRFTAEMSDKMQFFLDEDGQADLVAVTERTGAKLEITYKGAHASRPADEVDVDEFVGVKSHRAKGKRLTTYEVATLRFIEPELPPEPEPSDDGDAGEIPDGLLSGGGADDGAADAGAGDAAAVSGGVEFEIERARGDADEVIDPEQLNLF